MFANEISSGSQAFQSTTALYMKQNDPYLPSGFGRMVTASISSGASTYIADQNVDINNSHHTYSTANAGSTAISLPLAVSQTLAACACTTPIFFGEYTASAFETYPANLQTRSSYWSAFFSQATIAPYQGDTLVFSQFIGTPQLVQMAAISSYTQNFDPASTTLTVTTSGQSCGGCTVQNLALSSATNAGGYIWNNTSTTAITGMTATWTNQIASGVNNCQWIHPVDGSVISVFSSGTLGSHGYTVPTVTSGAAYQPDIVWSCNQVTTPSILTTTLPAGSLTAATTYSQTLTAVGGAGAPYTWALTKGAMPPGLTLNTGTGVISGVAITAGYWHFSITAKDSSSVATSAQSYIIPIMALPTIGNTAVDNAVLGRAEAAVTSQVVVVGGCQPIANSMTVTGLVSGLSIAANMSLSGTPTASGSMTMNPSVTDACGNTVTSPTVAVVTPVQPGASSVALVTANMQGCTQGGICSISLQSRVATGATTIALTTGSLLRA